VRRAHNRAGTIAAAFVAAAVVGCALPSGVGRSPPSVHQQERFQPEGVVSALATAYASAQEDRCAPKKVPNHTRVGVGPFGSISVPLSSSEDSLVKRLLGEMR
jgi:hypothetical protein